VYLLVNHASPAALIEILDNREEFVIDVSPNTLQGSIRYQVAHIFHERELGVRKDTKIQLRTSKDTQLGAYLRIRPRAAAVLPGFDGPELELISSYQSAVPDELGRTGGEGNLPLHAGYDFVRERRYSRPTEGWNSTQFLTVSPANFEELADLWDRIIRAPDKESIIVKALQILEPRIEDLRFTTKRTAGGTFVKLTHLSSRVAVSSLGEGVRRLLALSLSAVMAESGVLLVDEIDTALYHGVQPDMWRLLIEIAQRFNVQIFATTHSWDCVEAFQEALVESPDESVGRLFRLEARGENIRKVLYDAEDLVIAVREGIEVR